MILFLVLVGVSGKAVGNEEESISVDDISHGLSAWPLSGPPVHLRLSVDWVAAAELLLREGLVRTQ